MSVADNGTFNARIVKRFMKEREFNSFCTAYENAKLAFGVRAIDMDKARKMMKMAMAGESIKSIGKTFGFKTDATVYRHIALAGVDLQK
jgi:hypothetical protein